MRFAAVHRSRMAQSGQSRRCNNLSCRFQKLDSSVPVMQSAQDCMGDDVPDAVDRAPVRRILSEQNMRTPPIIIGGEFCKDPPQVLFVEHDQMIGTLAPDRPDQARMYRSSDPVSYTHLTLPTNREV